MSKAKAAGPNEGSLVSLKLPRPPGMRQLIAERRIQLDSFRKQKANLVSLFRRCADGDINSARFYADLPNYWGEDKGDRIQGKGWEIKGKHSNFKFLSRSMMRIIDAEDDDRDDIVAQEFDNLSKAEIPTRRAFFSEMLCLNFPDKYPLLNNPVHKFLIDNKLRAPKGASEGDAYIYIATELRLALLENPGHPTKNLAELDSVIWGKYKKQTT